MVRADDAERTPASWVAEARFEHTFRQLGAPRGHRRRLGRGLARIVAGAIVVAMAGVAWHWFGDERVRHEQAARVAPVEPMPVASRPRIASATPEGRKLRLRAGTPARFEVDAQGDDLLYRWSVDGMTAGTGPEWVFSPRPDQVGRRRIEVAIFGSAGTTSRMWAARIEPADGPRVVSSTPASDEVEAQLGAPVRFAVSVRTDAEDETLETTWTVNGTHAGEGGSFRLDAQRAGTFLVRSVTTSSLGAVLARDWRVVVTAPPAPALAEAPAPTVTASAPDPAPVVPATPAKAPAISAADVRALLDRYASAFRRHDVAELERLGQVSGPEQARKLQRYFDSIGDLEVEVRLLGVSQKGGRPTVRFVRKDRFRDPAGREVALESPPIESELSLAGGTLRFAGTPR